MNALTYIAHRIRCSSAYRIHSPFVYSFYTEVVRPGKSFSEYKEINAYWKFLRNCKEKVSMHDLGAGSKKKFKEQESIRKLASSSSSDPAKANFLFRLSRFAKAKKIIELGTHLGMGSLALKKGSPDAEFFSFEGNPAFIDFIRNSDFKDQFSDIKIMAGNFDESFPELLSMEKKFDLIYIDGNHSQEATIRYFKLIIQKNAADSIIVFDDIRWSKEMQQAWKKIIVFEECRLCFDFYFFGIIFTSKAYSKQNFRLPFP